jgi:alpha-galactosidase
MKVRVLGLVAALGIGCGAAAADAGAPPFSFVLGGRKHTEKLEGWKRTAEELRVDGQRILRAFSFSDPASGLEVRAETVRFADFPAVEWVLRFRNGGSSDSPVIEDVLPLDGRIAVPAGARPVLHHARGALCSIDDFAPVETPLDPGTRLRLEPGGGRSSSEHLPFFNVHCARPGSAEGEGVIIGIGWTGEWAASFGRDGDAATFAAGMALTRLRLRPGEEIRTPRILVIPYGGDRWRGQNLLRRFILAHHRPRPAGMPLVLPVLVGSWGGSPAAEHLKTIDRIVRGGLPIDLYWIDAEWFGKAPWYTSAGDWKVRADLYPQGFRPIAEALHRSGRRLLVWWEPQRVCAGTPWAADLGGRPGWLLALGPDAKAEYRQRNMGWGVPHEDPRWVERESHRSEIAEGDRLLNLGVPEARKFLADFLSARIDEFGLDWYREDFNIAPLEYWRAADPPGRQGITEIRFVEGLYALWDDLLARHPGLAIDNCASGGRRIDLETIGRATPLWRTDWPADAIHRQCHSFGLLAWVPLHMSEGTVLSKGNEYEVRSAMTAGLNVKLPPGDDEASLREIARIIEQYRSIRKFYEGDFYPLTEYSQAPDAWIACQLDLPKEGEGIAVVLKRPKSGEAARTLRLRALDPAARYRFEDLDGRPARYMEGGEAAEKGIEVRLDRAPDSAVFLYTRLRPEGER